MFRVILDRVIIFLKVMRINLILA